MYSNTADHMAGRGGGYNIRIGVGPGVGQEYLKIRVLRDHFNCKVQGSVVAKIL